MTARDYGKTHIYFRYEVVYYKANFSPNFANQYKELVANLNLFVPIDYKTDVKDGNIKPDIFFQKLYDQNKNNGLKEKLSQYSIENRYIGFSYYGGVYDIKIADRVNYRFSLIAFDKITGRTIVNRRWSGSFEKIPSIEDAMSKNLEENIREYLYFPYITDGTKIYKVSVVFSTSDFAHEYSPEELVSAFKSYQGYQDNQIRCRFFLKVEEYSATYKYVAVDWNSSREKFSKVVTTSNHPKNFRSREINNEFNQVGYEVLKHQGHTYDRIRLSEIFRTDGQTASFWLKVHQIRFGRNNIRIQVTYRYYKKEENIHQFKNAGSLTISFLTKTVEYSYYDHETHNIFMEDGKEISEFFNYLSLAIIKKFNGHVNVSNGVVYYADGTVKKISEINDSIPRKGMIFDVDVIEK